MTTDNRITLTPEQCRKHGVLYGDRVVITSGRMFNLSHNSQRSAFAPPPTALVVRDAPADRAAWYARRVEKGEITQEAMIEWPNGSSYFFSLKTFRITLVGRMDTKEGAAWMNLIRTLSVQCPKCDAKPGRPCMGTRIPSCSTMGGGWGGPVTLSRSHTERVQHARAQVTTEGGA